jgi:predicted DCC family thiol-disulfide oxidoreductase YuxK
MAVSPQAHPPPQRVPADHGLAAVGLAEVRPVAGRLHGYREGMTGPQTDVLIFDGECGFCTWCAAWAERRLPPGATTMPWQWVDDPSAYGLTREELAEAAYWVDGRGRAHRGHLAVAETFRAIGGAWRIVGDLIRSRGVSPIAAGVYEVVSRNRGNLPGATPACRRVRWPPPVGRRSLSGRR